MSEPDLEARIKALEDQVAELRSIVGSREAWLRFAAENAPSPEERRQVMDRLAKIERKALDAETSEGFGTKMARRFAGKGLKPGDIQEMRVTFPKPKRQPKQPKG
jgi:hypothetical protein